MTDDLDAALRGLRAAARVERHGGVTREQHRQMTAVVEHRIHNAVKAGATSEQVAEALYVGLSRAQQRIRTARRNAQPEPVLKAPNIWREVRLCGRPAPPPWPVSSRCQLNRGHNGDHSFRRRREASDG